MNKNDRYVVTIEDIGMDGEGIAKVDGQVVFVPFALLHEEVEIQIINTKTKFAIGKIVNIIKQSELRVTPKCPYFFKCGGCDVQHISYESQLRFKEASLKNTLKKVGGIDFEINSIIPNDKEFEYRNKVALPIVNQNGKTQIGMYRKNSHKIVEIENCLIQEPFVKKLIEITDKYIKDSNIVGYDEELHTGELRHLVARCHNNKVLVTLVSANKNLKNLNTYAKMLEENFDEYGLELNINNKRTNVIMGNETIHISGIDALSIEEMDVKYSVSNSSFMQVNNYIRNAIYNYVLSLISNSDVILDLYSGAGVLTAMLSKKAKEVYGVEIVPSSVDNANKLMIANNITNVTNILGDVELELQKLSKKLKGNFSVVLDPPRKGVSEKVVETLNKTKPQKIIYISCNPATLSRDLRNLTQNFDILSITPFDMFPQTKHLETVVELALK